MRLNAWHKMNHPPTPRALWPQVPVPRASCAPMGGDGLSLTPVPTPKDTSADAEYVRLLYRTFLNREPDGAGFLVHLEALTKGWVSRDELALSFANCPEYRHRQAVTGLYRGLLGREPDGEGFARHFQDLQSGMPLHQVQKHFLESAEYLAGPGHGEGRIPDEAYVRGLYWGVLGRKPDLDGYRAHLTALQNGSTTRERLRQDFLACPEYQATLPPPPPPPPPPADPLKGMTEAQLKHLGATDRRAFLAALRPAAEEAERKYGVPAAITLAQAAHETGWGRSIIDGFNLFGIKGTGPAGSIGLPTQEYLNGQWVTVVAKFARYHDFTEAVVEHGKLFHNGYYDRAMRQYAQDHDPVAFAHNITGIYATDPGYGNKLVNVMREYNLI